MDTTASSSRIRWDNQELDQVAARMHQLLAADPQLGPLEAVRRAQACLPAERQRDIKTWALMQARLQPKLDALDAQVASEPGLSAATLTEPAIPARHEVAEGVVGVPLSTELPAMRVDEAVEAGVPALDAQAEAVTAAAHAPAVAAAPVAPPQVVPGLSPDTLMAEAAFVAALRSPAVESALVEVFGRAMSKAFARLSERGAAADEPETATPKHAQSRALLAGFAAPMAKGLEEGIHSLCEVRVWRPNQGPQLFETLAKVCNVAVVPDEMDDEVVSDLRARNLIVIRHSGSAAKLYDRLEQVLS
jgi:hypothetical protein